MRSYIVLLSLCTGILSVALADDFETPGERLSLGRQLAPYGLPGWHPLKQPASKRASNQVVVTEEELRQRIQRHNDKLDSIKLPKVDFRDTPLADALSWIKNAAKQNDIGGLEQGKGVLVLKTFKILPGEDHPSVTLSLTDVTLREALVQLVTPHNLAVEVRHFGVAIVRRR